MLPPLPIVVLQQRLQAPQQVGMLAERDLRLHGIEPGDVLQHQSQPRHHNVDGMAVLLRPQKLRPHFFEKPHKGVALPVVQSQRLTDVVGKIGVARHPPAQFAPVQEVGGEKQGPPLGLNLLAGVGLAPDLAGRDAHQRVLRHVVPQLPVRKRFRALVGDEDPIHIVTVQAVAAMLQLIVVYHTDVRVQHRRPDITRIVVDTVDFKYLLHSFSPFMEHKTQSCKNSESVQVSTKFTPQPTSHPPRMGSPVWRPWPTPPASTPAATGNTQWNKRRYKYLRTGGIIGDCAKMGRRR